MTVKRPYMVWHLATEADRRPIEIAHFVLCACSLSGAMLALAAAYADLMQTALGAATGAILALVLGASPKLSRRAPLLLAVLFFGAWLLMGPTPAVMSAVLALWGLWSLLRCQFVSQVARIFPPILSMVACALTKSETLAVSVLAIASIMQLLVAMAWSSQAQDDKPGPLIAAKNLFLAGAITVPVALACFLLFPRMPLGFNELPLEGAKGQTGLSDSMTPGSVAELVRNPKLAFTASFYVETLRPAEMYWRAAVFDVFDGRTWRAHPSQAAKPPATARAKTAVAPHYEVSLPPSMGFFVPLLEGTSPSQVTLMTSAGAATPLLPNAAGVFENRAFPGSPVKIEAVLQQGKLPYAATVPQPSDTQLPEGGNQRTRELAAAWYKESDSDTQKFIQRIRHEILTGPYRYTLRPDRWRGSDGIDQFMLESKAGFCEHYASAFVFMLRSVGIPSRVVTGYQGGEVDRLDVRMLYRDAHAWTEVWVNEKGWTRVDPTTFIDPMKVEASTRETLERPSGWKLRLEAWSQRMSTNWSELVVQYGEAQQQLLLEQVLGASRYIFAGICGVILIALGCIAGARSLRARAIWSDPDRALALSFQKVHTKLRGAGVDLPDAELSPGELTAHLLRLSHPDQQLRDWLASYEVARYAPPGSHARRHRELVAWANRWRPQRT